MSKRPFLIPFLVPAILVAVMFLAALAEILQYSFREFIPGSLDVGGFTLDNFARIYRPVYFMSYDGNALVTRPLSDETRPSQVVLARRAHTELGAGAEVFAAECRGLFGVAN